MNVKKNYLLDNKQEDINLFYKGSQRYKGIKEKRINTRYLPQSNLNMNNPSFQRNNTCVPENIRDEHFDFLDNAFKKNNI